MELWIQPCRPCAELYGQPATQAPHEDLALDGAGANAEATRRYTCRRCNAVFARLQAGTPDRQRWMLLNAGQH
ncbi:hypothetical protein FAZ98_28540 [Paraburkholderia acidisoli]|uniref:Uncharacterized protein n=2 Tax=Paraburkholderia acidisoli TaxID=2571748 RepID=A0A7Z2GPW1_9BURK|nr:hypothetical protein FAZ98_28540 [Paraburkholderia acidisoli]